MSSMKKPPFIRRFGKFVADSLRVLELAERLLFDLFCTVSFIYALYELARHTFLRH
jgi:hypothetical protein